MARGWESKAVEAQLEEAERAAQERSTYRPISAEMLARAQKFESFRLVRSQLRAQLEKARSEAQRQRLKQALADLEQKLADLA